MNFRVLIALMLFAPSTLAAQGVGVAVSEFDEGNRRYRLGDFEGALNHYERALTHGYASTALYYNMGNAYYRLDNIGQAVRYYEKARRLGRETPELSHNLAIAREQTEDRFSRLPEPFWMPLWRGIVELIGPPGLFAVGMLFYLSACAAIAMQIRSGQTPWRRRVRTFGLAAAVCFLTLGFASSAEEIQDVEAVVLVEEVSLLNAPDGDRSDLRVHEGLVVDVVAASGTWSEVRLPNGARGWLPSAALGKI